MLFAVLIFFVLRIGVFCSENKKGQIEEPFIPTNEWQSLKKGQKVASGLHYRINFKTGLVEAKLLNDKNEKTEVLELPPKLEVLEIEKQKHMSKQLKYGETQSKPVYHTYEEIKEELGTFNITSKIDTEILKELVEQHKYEMAKEQPNVGNILTILDDFDFLGHQFDNGLEFVRQNGFSQIIYKNLNSSNDDIKQNTLKLFGSLVQNNARVQIHALETGSLPILLRFLNADSKESIKSKALFALGCLLRRFPSAQKKFSENGGAFIVAQIFEKDSIKIQLKIITLMTDLFIEKREVSENLDPLTLKEYHNIPLESDLLNQNWCYHINKLLADLVNNYQDDHDSIEKCLISMDVVGSQCKGNFNQSLLLDLVKKYQLLVETNKEDEFFNNVVKLCENILSHAKEKYEL